MNNTISYSSLRENLKHTLDDVCNTHIPILVKRKQGEDVVILARSDFESLEETNYLLSSSKNASRLQAALERKPGKRASFKTIKELDDEVRNRS
jgi:antitoxin YefM